LIPRQETEILVDKIAAQAKAGVLWDLCTGSGAIGIALKKRNPELKVVLSDLSPAALAVAKLNADKNGVEVEIREGDLFNPFKAEQADWIVSNPPYIAEGEWDSLDSEVRGFEPRMALISGRTGLEFYERFSHELPRFLKPGGSAFFEIGKGQGKAVKELFDKAPFENVLVEPDWAGHDRFFSLKIKEDFCKVV
jgi:release factor glutamine methyltransferase